MADTSGSGSLHYRIRRDAQGALAWFTDHPAWARLRSLWRGSRLFRLAGYALAALAALYLLVSALLLRDLPSAETLLDYQPPLPTMVRGADGGIVYSYARERRVQLRFVDLPRPVINAYLAAEDKTFWTHGGLDYLGLIRAAFEGITSGETPRGTSTITQQVAKNLVVGNEVSYVRKLREAFVARRIESVLSKEQIIELYLNEIALGRRSFGVQAAARAYFDKDVDQLGLHEAAFLAILPKAPERYGRPRYEAEAIQRRNYVLDQMVDNEWATPQQAAAAKAQPLGLVPQRNTAYSSDIGYYVEEVRRRLIGRYGEQAEDGPNSVYAGGLWVRTSLDPALQKAVREALRGGLMRYHAGKGWREPIAHIDLDPDKWQTQLIALNKTVSYQDWKVGVVVERDGPRGTIGFTDGTTAPLSGMPDALRAGNVIAVAPAGNGYTVRTIPEVSGGMVFQDPLTGRVLAMQGGFDPGLDSFNRATQALRQPGSTIKPFVYATGLDHGMTPATMVPDTTFCVYQGAALGQKCFRNFDSRGGGGTHTMRWGLEQSRNLMTIHIANDTGMDRVVQTIARTGIGKYDPYLSVALGAGDTTVLQMVNAFSSLANHGVMFEPTLIDYVQDRTGKVIWRADKRRCTGCSMADWDGKAMPRLDRRGKQALDPRTAYQTLHMLEGVVQRGTATVLRDLELPLFGKTGTTTGPTNVWFVGGGPNLVGGVYLGYDQPRSLGGYAQGGRIAAPMFKEVAAKTKPQWSRKPFVAPSDVRMVRIDRVTGKRVFDGQPSDDPRASIIWEAFKADTEPRRASRQDDLASQRDAILAAIRRGGQAQARQSEGGSRGAEQRDFVEEQGGLY